MYVCVCSNWLSADDQWSWCASGPSTEDARLEPVHRISPPAIYAARLTVLAYDWTVDIVRSAVIGC